MVDLKGRRYAFRRGTAKKRLNKNARKYGKNIKGTVPAYVFIAELNPVVNIGVRISNFAADFIEENKEDGNNKS